MMARTSMVKVLLEPADRKRLEEIAAAERRTLSSYVEGLILDAIKAANARQKEGKR